MRIQKYAIESAAPDQIYYFSIESDNEVNGAQLLLPEGAWQFPTSASGDLCDMGNNFLECPITKFGSTER